MIDKRIIDQFNLQVPFSFDDGKLLVLCQINCKKAVNIN